MPMPSPLYPLLKGNIYLTVAGALSETDADVTNYDQTNYRDTMDAAFQGYNVQMDGPLAPAPGNGVVVPLAGTLTAQTDEFTHTAPRNQAFKRTERRWWDGAGGTGNLVGKCFLDRFIGWSGGIPKRV